MKKLVLHVVETICYENNSLLGIYYNVSQNLHLQVIFSTEKQDFEKRTQMHVFYLIFNQQLCKWRKIFLARI